MEDNQLQSLLYIALKAAMEASGAISNHYQQSIYVETKEDGSPITEADRQANSIIMKHLEKTGLPVISEESEVAPYEQRRHWEWFWLVDPLDGTKEYISRTGEFTVNIALIHKNTPVLGVITAPALNTGYVGWVGKKVWKIDRVDQMESEHPDWQEQEPDTFTRSLRLFTTQPGVSVGVSRSHRDAQTDEMIGRLHEFHDRVNLISKGSSLKLCHMAENLISIYPRFSPTHEWDTAAGHAILKAAGGEMYQAANKKPLEYNKPQLKNPAFIAMASTYDSERYFSELAL
ncbi:MAG: 3'(2'),5'-bisphosphate nucleotidase CysQ [Bacteroidales bacterium]